MIKNGNSAFGCETEDETVLLKAANEGSSEGYTAHERSDTHVDRGWSSWAR